ncbi:mitochondrial fission process protein 1 [Limosa lapponica baueri]|uniref:Mitochondrial fission process protein 1 n=1 Tax=Limosa lapponica baueri TaxID=1758121 RepID=A0A2I0TAX5_LIMLA|nr:mitochondrial fission process protein 1 [Limosa lapponica baueri]
MGNKQDELKAIVQQDSYDVVAIMETWWDDCHDWNAAMNGYKLARKERLLREGVALYIRECFDCIELDSSDDEVECLWDEEADEVFYKQLAEAPQSPALVLVGDFQQISGRLKYNTAESRQARRFLECMEDNFLTQLVVGVEVVLGLTQTTTTASGEWTIGVLKEWFGTLPMPSAIQSDSGSHFTAAIVQEWAKGEGIDWVFHTPYYP